MTGRNEWCLPWLVAVSTALLLGGCGGGTDRTTEDAMLVRCLDPDARSQIAEAAVAIGLAGRGPSTDLVRVADQDLSIEQWYEAQPSDFRRACAAMIAAAGVDIGGSGRGGSGAVPTALLTAVLSLLVAVLTAMVAGAVTSWLNDSGRRQQLADALRRAAADLGRVGAEYVDGYRDRAPKIPQEKVLKTVAELDAAAERIATAHPSWRVLRQVPEPAGPPLDDRLDEWTARNATRPTFLRDLEKAFAYRVALANWQASLVERPIRSWPALRRRHLPTIDATLDRRGLPAQRGAAV